MTHNSQFNAGIDRIQSKYFAISVFIVFVCMYVCVCVFRSTTCPTNFNAMMKLEKG